MGGVATVGLPVGAVVCAEGAALGAPEGVAEGSMRVEVSTGGGPYTATAVCGVVAVVETEFDVRAFASIGGGPYTSAGPEHAVATKPSATTSAESVGFPLCPQWGQEVSCSNA